MSGNKYNEANEQAWPSFVDILSSTVLVLSFALLVLIIVLSVTRVTTSIRQEDHETSPTSLKIQTEVLGDYRQEYQKRSIVAKPSLQEENQVDTDKPVVDDNDKIPVYVPKKNNVVIDKVEKVTEVGDSKKRVIGDIPKSVDAKSLEVLEELLVVQKDVIEQQRKVIEQQDQDLTQTVRDYQSLLSLITEEKEIEDLRQKINPKDQIAKFNNITEDSKRLSGESEDPTGNGSMFLTPPINPTATVSVNENKNAMVFNFQDNAPFLTENSVNLIKEKIQDNLSNYKNSIVVLESKVSDYAVSAAEAQRIAVDRLLIFRSLLIDAGIPASSIKLKTVATNKSELSSDDQDSSQQQSDFNDNQDSDSDNQEVLNYGWISIKKDG